MHFKTDKKPCSLQGLNHQLVSEQGLCNLMQQGYSSFLSQIQVTPALYVNETITALELLAVLEEFAAVFEQPKTLPPSRVYDHRIPLEEEATTINIRPYRHSAIQKDVLEKMVQEMLDSGIMRHSVSPYSSPVVLVKKKDNS